MFHKIISTDADFGSQCVACGAAFDAGSDVLLTEVESLVPCTPHDGEAHHWVAEHDGTGATVAACHYCPVTVTEHTLPADVPAVCEGER